MDKKFIVWNFIRELRELCLKHGVYIDCHSDFVSLLKDSQSDEVLCVLYGDCEPDLEEEEIKK